MDAIDITLRGIRDDRQLHYENYQVVSTVQALWGAITPNMVEITMRCIGEEVHLYFLLGEESALDREEIDDVATALGALQFTSIPIETHVAILGEHAQGFQQQEGRLIYRRYESSESSS